jgi:hypothetical protein
VPTRVQFEFLDQGGSENLSVNGSVRCSVGRELRRPEPPRLAGGWSCYGRREPAPGAAVGRDWPGPSRAGKSGRRRQDRSIAFRAGPVELEFQVGFEAGVSSDAGVRVWVLSVGAKGEATRSTSHRLKVTLTPVDRRGKDTLIGSVGSK